MNPISKFLKSLWRILMSTVQVTLVTQQEVTTSQGVAIKVVLTKSDGTKVDEQNVAAPYSATFLNVPDGTGYTITAVAVDVNGSPVGTSIYSPTFDVSSAPAPAPVQSGTTPEAIPAAPAHITSDVPSNITVTVLL